jgi:hypothetical protein
MLSTGTAGLEDDLIASCHSLVQVPQLVGG